LPAPLVDEAGKGLLITRPDGRRFMKLAGLDIGDKTIGVAVSDDLLITAQSRMTIKRSTLKEDIDNLIEFFIAESVKIIVIGLPKNLDNTIGPQAQKVISFSKNLEKKLKYSERTKHLDIAVELFDERLTTKLAEIPLMEADMSRKRRKEVVDKLAAAIILQDYLELNRKKFI
jgi:putative holliday junction resolvase